MDTTILQLSILLAVLLFLFFLYRMSTDFGLTKPLAPNFSTNLSKSFVIFGSVLISRIIIILLINIISKFMHESAGFIHPDYLRQFTPLVFQNNPFHFLIINNILFAAACSVLYLFITDIRTVNAAKRAVIYLCIIPTTLLSILPGAGNAVLLFGILFLWMYYKKNWLACSLSGGILLLFDTRMSTILAAVVISKGLLFIIEFLFGKGFSNGITEQVKKRSISDLFNSLIMYILSLIIYFAGSFLNWNDYLKKTTEITFFDERYTIIVLLIPGVFLAIYAFLLFIHLAIKCEYFLAVVLFIIFLLNCKLNEAGIFAGYIIPVAAAMADRGHRIVYRESCIFITCALISSFLLFTGTISG